MEGWGLASYRESSLLFNKNSSTESQRDKILQTISHGFVVSKHFSDFPSKPQKQSNLSPTEPMVRLLCEPVLVELSLAERGLRQLLF